ncbi:hypothetical protein [Microbacterium esteraromaticum]|uniref:hypothetical protein n=1 Tax=Microbacterium esteraromaticum TaxID=57043 RepID=UPI001181427E|nr:hypothetical protein [Microbacterium esteraromaticum]
MTTVLVAVGAAVTLGGSFAAMAATEPTQPQAYEGGLQGMYSDALKALDPTSPSYPILLDASITGEIDSHDYEAAHRMYVSCMNRQGFEPSFRETREGLYIELPYTDVIHPDALDEAVMTCSKQTGPVTTLYRMQVSNPDAILDSRLVAVHCLAESEYVEGDYSTDQFEKDMRSNRLPFDATETIANDCLYGAGFAYFDMSNE